MIRQSRLCNTLPPALAEFGRFVGGAIVYGGDAFGDDFAPLSQGEVVEQDRAVALQAMRGVLNRFRSLTPPERQQMAEQSENARKRLGLVATAVD
jgi:hypothetical protein